MDITFYTLGLVSLISGVSCACISDKRGGSPIAWFLLGMCFGPFAIIIALTAGKDVNPAIPLYPKKLIMQILR